MPSKTYDSRANDGRWTSAFARFVASYGVADLAEALSIDPSAIYHWLRGATHPRVEIAHEIRRLAAESGMRLTLDKIYAHSERLRKAEPGATPASMCS